LKALHLGAFSRLSQEIPQAVLGEYPFKADSKP
jgi:hypothetical protein